jgi:hypothetical protein
VQKVEGTVPSLRSRVSDIAPELDAIVMRALSAKASERFADAAEMARAIESHAVLAKRSEVSDWVQRLARAALATRAALVSEVEKGGQSEAPPPLHTSSGVQPVASASIAPTRVLPQSGRGQAWAVESPSGTSAPAAAPRAGDDSTLSAVVRAQSRKIRLMLLGIAGSLVAGGALLGGVLSGERSPSSTALPEQRPSSPVSAVSVHSAPEALAPLSAPLASAPRGPTPSAPSSALAAGGEPASAAAPASSARPRSTIPSPSKPASKRRQAVGRNCDPPYRIDAKGHRVFKVECF